MKRKKGIVIADKYRLVRQGLRSLLGQEQDLAILDEAEDGISLMRAIETKSPDLVIMGTNIPKMDGASVVHRARKLRPGIKFVLVAEHAEEEHVHRAFKSGVDGYCLTTSSCDDLRSVIRTVLKGNMYISPEISGKLMDWTLSGTRTVGLPAADGLTPRETEILRMVAGGCTNKEIAEILSVGVNTVKKHRGNMMRKLDLHSASALTAYAAKKRLISNSPQNH